MGTRALIHITEKGKTIVTIYKHCDGGPKSLGEKIRSILHKHKIVNGLTLSPVKVFNGMGCLAATLVKELKRGPGDIYLRPPKTCNVGEDWVYVISPGKDGLIKIKIECIHEKRFIVFDGLLDSLDLGCEDL